MRIVWTQPALAVVYLATCVVAAPPAAAWANAVQEPSPAIVTQTPSVVSTAPRSLLADVTFDVPDAAQSEAKGPSVLQPRRRHVGRGMLEMGAFLTYSATNYWRKYASFIEDWQFKLNWRDQRRKFFTSEGLRLDSNNFRLNWTHGAAGALYYSFGRTNGVGTLGSFLFSASGSLLWEYGAEWREISSINDHIYTAIGGVAIGESLFQIGNYFRNRSGASNRLAMVATNPLVALNDLLDGKNRPPRAPIDTWHDFRLSAGVVRGAVLPDRATLSQGVLVLDLQLVTLPEYGKNGIGSGRARSTMDSAFHLDARAIGGQIEEFHISTRATLFGRWWKNVQRDAHGLPHGHDLWVGAQVAWDVLQKRPIVSYDGHDLGMKDQWFVRERPTQYTDKVSSVHFPGPTVSLTTYTGRLRTRLDLGAALNFSTVNSLPFNLYSATHDTWGVKTTLQNWGYYYALGTTLTGRAEAEMGVWRATAGVDYRRFGSIQGLDRFQDHVTDDSRLRDSRFESSASLTVRIPRSTVFSCVRVEHVDRRGWFHATAAHAHETRVSYEIGVRF